MIVVRSWIALACACSSGAPAADHASAPPVATRDGAVVPDAPLRDENAAAKLAFTTRPGRSLMGHTRASWPLDLPEMPWVADTFVNLELDTFDGVLVTGSVGMYAAPGLDARKCTVEILWDRSRTGVQLAGAPTIDNIDERIGTHATWRFRSQVVGGPPAINATAFVFCPNDVMFYSIEMIAPGPKIREAYCKEVRHRETSLGTSLPVGAKTFDLLIACGALVRLRGRELIDECRDNEILLSIDALGAGITAHAPAAGTDPNDDELRRWYGGSDLCAEVHLVASPTFPASGQKPFADFVKRAGIRLHSAFSRDGMIQR